MPSSIHQDRVTHAKAKPSSSSQRRSSSTRQNQLRQAEREEQHRKPPPLVERTNELSIEQFKSTYVPATYESLKMPVPANRGDSNSGSGPDSDLDQDMDEMDYVLDIYTAKSIPDADFEACFGLVELTSLNAYSGSSIGWSPAKKRKEMKLPDMRYMIARQGSRNKPAPEKDEASAPPPAQGEMLGFLSFMVTYEDGDEVIYCYEIHLSPTAQGLGLGGQMMLTLQGIGRQIGLEKVMLTVFKSNAKALRFYDRLGLEPDEYSPPPRKLRNGTVKDPDYLILSKALHDRNPSATMTPDG